MQKYQRPLRLESQSFPQIIWNQEYIGNVVCNKAMTKSLMSKKLIKFLPPKWIVGKITHEAIIDKHIFE
ncbi:MAG: recombinase family protein, partial [Bacilli bacterium]